MQDDLPQVRLADLPGGADDLVLCNSARLAADLRRAHGEAQMHAGKTTWRALQSATPAQWLDHFTSAALLRGEIPPEAMPGQFLTRPQERALWEDAVATDAEGRTAELFDREGLAQAAMEAEALARLWRIDVPEAFHTGEYRAFLRWQQQVRQRCAARRWHTQAEAVLWRIECLARGAGVLPQRVLLAGFTAADPVLGRVQAVLAERDTPLFRLDFSSGGDDASLVSAGVAVLPDRMGECRAAAEWARAALQRRPAARVRIAVADLPATRRALEAALDAALHPAAIGAGWAEAPLEYAFVAGQPLADEMLVDVALRLLNLFARPQRVALAEFGALLCGVGWSGDVSEADLRARLDVALRGALPPETTLERIVREARRWLERAAGNGQGNEQANTPGNTALTGHLAVVLDAARGKPPREAPSGWATQFRDALAAFGWPGERPLLAAGRAACAALQDVLAALAPLDGVLGRVDAGTALREVKRACREQSFKPPRIAPPRLEICSLNDAVAGPADGLWVMGLNEGAWPPVPRPNPLLPPAVQRSAGVPAASVASLAAEAAQRQGLWACSASGVVFSWAQREGERELRPSPLLALLHTLSPGAVAPAAESVAYEAPVMLEYLDDARAPAVTPEERVRGGTSLLAAQAVCPAWAFYRYRLGAAVLPEPTFGLDALARGSLLHLALEAFWQGRAQADLLRLQGAAAGDLDDEIARVVAHALDAFNRRAIEPLPPRAAALEAQRLRTLLARWLMIEAARPAFRVVACEERHEISIEGLPVRLVVDRVDELADGRLVILDYKSGKSASAESWARERMSEPQLPVYASFIFTERPLAAVALARVTTDAPGFSGVAEEAGVLPEVKPLDAQRRRYAEAEFPDWDAVRVRWAERIRALACEVKDGVAAVVYEREADLDWCEVKPVLRLAERRRQWEDDQ